jgi:hypothetical protein
VLSQAWLRSVKNVEWIDNDKEAGAVSGGGLAAAGVLDV